MVNMGTVDLYWLQNSIEFMDIWIKFFSLMHQRLWSTEGKKGTGQGRRAIGSIHLNINSPFYGFYGQCNVVGTIKCISWFTSLGQRFTLCHFIIHSLKLNPFVNIEGLVSLTSTSKLYLGIHEFIYCSWLLFKYSL